jgi:heptosyltransferase-2
LIKRIKEWDPEARVVLACRPGLGEFFTETGLADEVVTINKKDKKQAAEAMASLRAREWDVVFVPHESVRTALMMSRLKAKHKVSFRQWWNGIFYDKRVQKPMDYPDALRQLSLLTPLDGRLAEMFAQEDVHALRNLSSKQDLVDYRAPEIPEWASMKIMGLKPEGKRVFMAPGSTWNTKRWTPAGYTELARALMKEGYDVILVGSKDERPLCAEIAAAAGGNVVNRAGETSLKDLVQLLRTGRALITNDSGSMHAAAVSGLPTVAVFGPTTLDLGFRPWNNSAVVVQRDMDCRPCGKHGHDKCPLGHHHCMEKIEAAQVLRAFKTLVV